MKSKYRVTIEFETNSPIHYPHCDMLVEAMQAQVESLSDGTYEDSEIANSTILKSSFADVSNCDFCRKCTAVIKQHDVLCHDCVVKLDVKE